MHNFANMKNYFFFRVHTLPLLLMGDVWVVYASNNFYFYSSVWDDLSSFFFRFIAEQIESTISIRCINERVFIFAIYIFTTYGWRQNREKGREREKKRDRWLGVDHMCICVNMENYIQLSRATCRQHQHRIKNMYANKFRIVWKSF